MAFESLAKGAQLRYKLDSESRITLYFHAHPKGPSLTLKVDERYIGSVDTYSQTTHAFEKTFTIPKRKSPRGEDKRVLKINSAAAGARLFGISYLRKKRGLLYDAVGPVGADARVYLSLDPQSFAEHLKLLKPDLVIVMLGGNDALRVRNGKASIQTIAREHDDLLRRVQNALPESDCMLWSPMDAGQRVSGRIESKSHIAQIRSVQQRVAIRRGCAFWDMYRSMGEEGAIARWSKARIINKDLVHPRRKAGELLGYLFSESFLNAYDQAE